MCFQLVASKLEVVPGSEFRVAFEEAMKYGGRVVLGDRPDNVRSWNLVSSSIVYYKGINI